ncbi:unnamed protein product [Acanthoscelides obtectus]|uniref:FLYWCH-type domain-containing protein n=1 Tax=Acanthoscelides obtectus TaxID=200917 RepID=A0A9P0L0D2_ACAOB|nr:unnamed protein product [Acanthoscelides obtectus]CAK1676625.1 hypothetical protein AOBTE_LOCUS30867 [Acanthoscelides obtectus]
MLYKDTAKTKWRCVTYDKTKCKSIVFSAGKTVSIRNCHNHEKKTIDPKTILVPQYVKVVRM